MNSGRNNNTMYIQNYKQQLNPDVSSKGNLASPEFTKVNQSFGESQQAKITWYKVSQMSNVDQNVSTQKVKDVIAENQSKFYNGLNLNKSTAPFLKENQQVSTKAYGGSVAVANNEIPLQDQTIGGTDSRINTNINQVYVNQQNEYKRFQPQYNAALNRQLTEQQPVDQSRAVEEYNPELPLQKQHLQTDLSRYNDMQQYTNYMNTFNNQDSRYHKIDQGHMIKINPVQTPYTNQGNSLMARQQQQINYSQPNNYMQNQQLQPIQQQPTILNRDLLSQQRLNLFQDNQSRRIIQPQYNNLQNPSRYEPNQRQIQYSAPNHQYNRQYISPQTQGRTLQSLNNRQINYNQQYQNNFGPNGLQTQQSYMWGGGSPQFNPNYLFNRAGRRF